jgi:hypothetical protein
MGERLRMLLVAVLTGIGPIGCGGAPWPKGLAQSVIGLYASA